jgi:hypothetical protein
VQVFGFLMFLNFFLDGTVVSSQMLAPVESIWKAISCDSRATTDMELKKGGTYAVNAPQLQGVYFSYCFARICS